MKISEVIKRIKNYYKGNEKITEKTTRDKILYGANKTDRKCTGIVTAIWVTADVIKKAQTNGANLISCHEALFWNHGDHVDWLVKEKNKTFIEKMRLLDKADIVIWRNHDYIHSGIPINNDSYINGIFYGFAKEMGWEKYLVEDDILTALFELPEITATDIAFRLIKKLNLNGARIIGSLKTSKTKIGIPFHIFWRRSPRNHRDR